jgi:hypothetical protein
MNKKRKRIDWLFWVHLSSLNLCQKKSSAEHQSPTSQNIQNTNSHKDGVERKMKEVKRLTPTGMEWKWRMLLVGSMGATI